MVDMDGKRKNQSRTVYSPLRHLQNGKWWIGAGFPVCLLAVGDSDGVCCVLLQICEAYEAISTKMHERPTNIEELVELRDWLKGVPEQLAVQEVGQPPVGTGHQGK